MESNNILVELMKTIAQAEANLSASQINTLAVIKHLKNQLYNMSDFANLEIQKQWYTTAVESLKEHVKRKFTSNLKLPKDDYSYSVKAFKRINKEFLENLAKSIRSLPDSVLLKHEDSETHILPDELFINTRGYIQNLANQINVCYQNSCYDACSMCMRRLLEMLLVLTYQKHNKQTEIQDSTSGKIKVLSFIINYTQSNNQFHISKDVLDTLNEFRELGNFAAHKIQYNCFKKEIDNVKSKFRVTVHELLFKSGIKK